MLIPKTTGPFDLLQHRSPKARKPSIVRRHLLHLPSSTSFTLEAMVVDYIEKCTSRPLQVDEKYDNVDMAVGAGMFAWNAEAKQIARSLNLVEGSRQSDETSFRRTLAADMTHSSSPAPALFAEEYHKVCEYLKLLDDCNHDALKVATIPNAKELETFSNDSSFLDAWFLAAFQRRFCSTKGGRMGLVPGAALEGDHIAVILGADTPFVLRSAGADFYALVGECYIHGIMNGETLQGTSAQVKYIHII